MHHLIWGSLFQFLLSLRSLQWQSWGGLALLMSSHWRDPKRLCTVFTTKSNRKIYFITERCAWERGRVQLLSNTLLDTWTYGINDTLLVIQRRKKQLWLYFLAQNYLSQLCPEQLFNILRGNRLSLAVLSTLLVCSSTNVLMLFTKGLSAVTAFIHT